MKIIESHFIELSPKGAINLNINLNLLIIQDSTFLGCNNSESGGAIRITSEDSEHILNRLCAKSCRTLLSGSNLDWGQFLFVKSPTGITRQESLSVSMCTDRLMSTLHNSPITNAGNAQHRCAHSNVSDCYAQLGCGFGGLETGDAELSYMNFANDTTCNGNYDYVGYWIAVVFHQGTGKVSWANFVECRSERSAAGSPPGAFVECAFVRCRNYNSGFTGGHVSEPMGFSFPPGCAALRGGSNGRRLFRTSFLEALSALIATR